MLELSYRRSRALVDKATFRCGRRGLIGSRRSRAMRINRFIRDAITHQGGTCSRIGTGQRERGDEVEEELKAWPLSTPISIGLTILG